MDYFTTAEKRDGTVNGICSLPNLGAYQTICPHYTSKTELCLAALAASMIDKQNCFGERYEDCAIFFVNMRKSEEA